MTNKTPILIKKYPNRRLYNTDTSDYVTLEDIYNLIKNDVDFIVQDSKTGEDITRLILTQIIFERETKGYNMLPIKFLKQLIMFYDDNLRSILPEYLENSINSFVQNQDMFRKLTQNLNKTLEQISPINAFEQFTKQNIEILEQNMKAFYGNFNKAPSKDE
jgi:polyhydroxyalkanoate synthesis repressor PhaR